MHTPHTMFPWNADGHGISIGCLARQTPSLNPFRVSQRRQFALPNFAQDDSVSIIRLLRVFLGSTVGNEEDDGGASPGQPTPLPKAGQLAAEAAAAREQAGCALWDMSAEERHASAMCGAGLVPVSRAVLNHCAVEKARAEERGERKRKRAKAAGGVEAREGAVADTEAAEAEGPDAAKSTAESAAGVAAAAEIVPPGGEGEGLERLREIACGLLANACSHRNLR